MAAMNRGQTKEPHSAFGRPARHSNLSSAAANDNCPGGLCQHQKFRPAVGGETGLPPNETPFNVDRLAPSMTIMIRSLKTFWYLSRSFLLTLSRENQISLLLCSASSLRT